MPSIKGTASVSDSRALNKALMKTKFPVSFRESLDVSKINRTVLADWIESKIAQSLGFDDEIVQSTAVNLFLPEIDPDAPVASTSKLVDPKKAQIDLSGFLGDKPAADLCKEIWEALLDASKQQTGIPRVLLEEKKKELAATGPAPQERSSNSGDRHGVDPRARESGNRWGPRDPPRDDRHRTRSDSPYGHRRGASYERSRRGPHDYARDEHGYPRHRERPRHPYDRGSNHGRGAPDSSDYHHPSRYDDRRRDDHRHENRYRRDSDVYDEYGRRRHMRRSHSRSSSSSGSSSSSAASSRDEQRSRRHERRRRSRHREDSR